MSTHEQTYQALCAVYSLLDWDGLKAASPESEHDRIENARSLTIAALQREPNDRKASPPTGTEGAEQCRTCEARNRDWWKPDPEDPFWMLEADGGEWLKNKDSLLGTRDPAKALRFPTKADAENAKSSAWPVRWWTAKATEHSWVTFPSPALTSPPKATGAEDTLTPQNRDCLAKAKPNEPMFIILGRDPDGGNIVRLWAERRLAAGDRDHALPVLDIATAMDAWREAGNRPESAPDEIDYPALKPPPKATDKDVGRATRHVLHELRLSAQVFRDYGLQHHDKALEASDPSEAQSRERKSKRNLDRAAACLAALDAYEAAIATLQEGQGQ